jgi:drug/metabolite transporter (DMT)-like permease
MYLTPGVTAVMAWLLFREALTLVMILGLVVSAVGVAWAQGKR